VVLLVLSAPSAMAAEAGQEWIVSYAVSADVGRDGSVAVTERIRYHFTDPRHGIYRFIPLYYPLVHADGTVDRYDARTLEIDDYSATMDGQAVPLVHDTKASGSNENLVLRVGDEQRQITGDHDYRLSYRIRGLLNTPGGRPELFWDALGKETNVPVEHAVVTVTAPGPLGRVRCVTGTTTCDTAWFNGDSAVFEAAEINAYTAMTVTVQLPDTVTVPPPIVRARPTFAGRLFDNLLHPGREIGIPVLGVVITIAEFALGALLVLVLSRTRDYYFTAVPPGEIPPDGSDTLRRRLLFTPEPPAVRCEPPEGVPAALCGVLLHRTADRRVAAAVLTDLAVRGLLTITEVPGGFRVARARRKARGKVHTFERPVLGALHDGPVILTGRRRDALVFARALGSALRRLTDEAFRRGWFNTHPRNRRMIRAVGVMALIFSALPLIVLASFGLAWWWVPLGLAALTLVVKPDIAMPGRTALGSAVLSQALGFRQFLQTVETGQVTDDTSSMFNRYLPYALVFGLTKHWITRFAAVGITPGKWFTGNSDSGSSYAVFTSTTNSSVANPTVSVTSNTASSSGWSAGDSGFSGDSGGGFSGGDGGGGGGVGSW
jgi:uncharacterized membrane protein YgcG